MPYTMTIDPEKTKQTILSGINKTKRFGSGVRKAYNDTFKGNGPVEAINRGANAYGRAVKDTVANVYKDIGDNPKTRLAVGGTAALVGAGVAAKRYLKNRKEKYGDY